MFYENYAIEFLGADIKSGCDIVWATQTRNY